MHIPSSPEADLAREIAATCLCHKARAAARALTRRYDEALRPVGLRLPQFSLLVALSAGEAMSITAVADALGLERSTLSRNLGPLVRRGLVDVGGEGWRRARRLRISGAGSAALAEAMPHWRAAQARMRAALGEEAWREAQGRLGELAREA